MSCVFVVRNTTATLNDVMTLHLVLRVSNTRKYVMAVLMRNKKVIVVVVVVLTRIQWKLCDKIFIAKNLVTT